MESRPISSWMTIPFVETGKKIQFPRDPRRPLDAAKPSPTQR
jgi:hypothetical protein